MKKKTFYISIVLIVLFVVAYLSVLYIYVQQIKQGEIFRAYILQGCDLINEGLKDGVLSLTEKMYNTVVVEYGYPKKGMGRGMLRDFCEDVGTEECKYYARIYCQQVAALSN